MEKDEEEEEEGALLLRSKKLDAADLLDPNPDILALFCHYNHTYFHSKLHACTVEWSTSRMTLCAGICKYGFGSCSIRLSEPLLKFRSSVEVKETLLHEMIHAYLWLTNSNQNHDDHGPSFQKMMQAINDSQALDHQRPFGGYNITVYHNFTDEVNSYRKHHWKCIQCGDLIKRATNRAPSQSDCYQKTGWLGKACSNENCNWHRHQQHCGGEYKKIAEPEGYKSRKLRSRYAGVLSKESKMISEGPVSKELSTLQEKMIGSSGAIQIKNQEDKESCRLSKKASLETYFIHKSNHVDKEVPSTAIKGQCQPHESISGEYGRITTIETKRARICKSRDSNDDGRTYGQSHPENDAFCSVSEGKPPLAISKRQEVQNGFQRNNGQEDECTVIIGWRDWYAFEDEEARDTKALENKRSQRRFFERASSQLVNMRDSVVCVKFSGAPEDPVLLGKETAGFGKEKALGRKMQSSVALNELDSVVGNVAEVIISLPRQALPKHESLSSTPVSQVAANDAKNVPSEMLILNDGVSQDLNVPAASEIIPRPNDIYSIVPFCKEMHVPICTEQKSLIVKGDYATIAPCKEEVEGFPQAIWNCMDDKMMEKRSQISSEVKDLETLDEIKAFSKGSSKRQREGLGRLSSAAAPGEPAVACPICDTVLVGNIKDVSFNTRFNQHIDACMGGTMYPE